MNFRRRAVYYSHVNTNQNEAGGVLGANKTDFKVGSLTRDKDGCNEKRIHSGGSITVLNLYSLIAYYVL